MGAEAGYLDSIAKSDKSVCGEWAAVGVCPNCGTVYVRRLRCGREWCPECGRYWSESHRRRFERVWQRVSRMEVVGYFVFTVPMEYRDQFRDPGRMREARRKLVRSLKCYFRAGITRWHFKGDLSDVWNPHLNVLVDLTGERGYLDAGLLERLRERWSRIVGCQGAVVHYEYARVTPQVVHIVKYVTRATWTGLLPGEDEVAAKFYGFHNCTWWGEVGEEIFHDLEGEEGGSVEEGICRRCGWEVEWSEEVVAWVLVEKWGLECLQGEMYCVRAERRGVVSVGAGGL